MSEYSDYWESVQSIAKEAKQEEKEWIDLHQRDPKFIRLEYEEQVAHPGKFEGCHASVPYLWGQIIDGCSDEDFYFGEGEPMYSAILIDGEDRKIFPDLIEYGAILWEAGAGFVHCNFYTNNIDYDAKKRHLRKQAEEVEESE